MDAKILILDEPSAGLDPRARRTLINLLRELPITMLVSTHDMALVKELFPRTIVMDDGLVVADGKTKGILEDERLLNEHGLERPVYRDGSEIQQSMHPMPFILEIVIEFL